MCQKALYRHFYNYGMNVCNRYCKTSIEAEEIFNDAFLKILTKISQYNIELPFSAWMHTILIRSAINYLKKYRNRLLYSDVENEELIDSGVLSNSAISSLSYEELVSLIQSLPLSYRTAFNLAVIEGYSHSEIAGMLGITEGTSRSNLMVARKKLQFLITQQNLIRI